MTAAEKKENPLLSLAINIAIPALILMKLSAEGRLGPAKALIVALAFPFTYGLWDFVQKRKFNFISALGLVSILATGSIGLLQLDRQWIAVKEAAVPAIIGIVILGSVRTRFPLVRKFIYNDQILHVDRVHEALVKGGHEAAFEKLLRTTSGLLAASFFLSSVLNYVLARVILQSDPGTPTFNEELGRMTALSYPVIVVPSMVVLAIALWVLLRGIKKLTGLELDEVFKGGK